MSSSSSSKLDPLILLRRAISGRSDIHLLSADQTTKVFSLSESTSLSLPTSNNTGSRISIPKTLITRYKRPGTPADASPLTNPEHFYDSQSILCCYLNREKGFAAYIQEAGQQGCAFVSATERKLVTDYLEGKNVTEPSSVVSFELCKALYQDLEGRHQNRQEVENGSRKHDPSGGSSSTTNGQSGIRLVGDSNEIGSSSLVSGSGVSGMGGSGERMNGSPAKRVRYAVDKTDQELVKRIFQLHEPRQVADRKSVLRGNNNKLVNFEHTRTLVLDRIKASKEEMKLRASGGVGGASGVSLVKPVGAPGIGNASAKRRSMHPIIIISPSSSALITMHNVKRFLEDAVFEPPNAMRSSTSMGNTKITTSEDVVIVDHRRGYTTNSQPVATTPTTKSNPADRAARYFVVDGIEALNKFGEDAWDRVVCVMTTGQEWQFRPYKWSDPKELFHHVKGFFIQWTHDPPNPKVRAWNVTELRIDESKRHIDKSAAADFWRSLEAWIALHKPFVAY